LIIDAFNKEIRLLLLPFLEGLNRCFPINRPLRDMVNTQRVARSMAANKSGVTTRRPSAGQAIQQDLGAK
jgi:hypothetical protein